MHALILLALLQTTPSATPVARIREARRVAAYVEAVRAADEALVAGDAASARKGFEHALELSPRNPTPAYGLACAAARAGDGAAALDWLGRAVDLDWCDAAVAGWDPDLEGVRGEERFTTQLGRMDGLRILGKEPCEDCWAWSQILGADAERCATAVALSPDGEHVVAGHADGRVKVLDAATGRLERELAPMGGRIWALAIAPDGGHLAGVAHDGLWRVWDLSGETASEPTRAVEPSGWTYPFGMRLAWDPTGERLVIVDSRGDASLWSAAGELLGRWHAQGEGCAARVLWTPSGDRLLTSEGPSVLFRDGRTGERLGTRIDCPSEVVGLARSPDGTRIATGHPDAVVLLWDGPSGERKGRWQFVDPIFPDGDDVPVLSFSPDGERLAWSTRKGSVVEVVDLTFDRGKWQSEFLGAHFREAMRLVWSPDGRRVWYAFECGDGLLTSAGVGGEVHETALGFGSVPVCAGQRGAMITARCVTVAEAGTARMLWRRVEVTGGALVQAPSGHFTGTWTHLEGLRVTSPFAKEPLPLDASRIELLFDPKRVRAAQAGVVVVAPQL